MGKPMCRRIDDMVWPAPSERMDDLEWTLRHCRKEVITTMDLMAAATVISAYRQLITDTDKKRRYIIRELRQGANI